MITKRIYDRLVFCENMKILAFWIFLFPVIIIYFLYRVIICLPKIIRDFIKEVRK